MQSVWERGGACLTAGADAKARLIVAVDGRFRCEPLASLAELVSCTQTGMQDESRLLYQTPAIVCCEGGCTRAIECATDSDPALIIKLGSIFDCCVTPAGCWSSNGCTLLLSFAIKLISL